MRLALYLRFSLRLPTIDLWSLICSTHPLVTAQRGRVSLGKMLVRLVEGGLGTPSPPVDQNPVELLLNGRPSLKKIGISFFWIALEASAEEMSFAMSTFPPVWIRSTRLKGATYVYEMAMLMILADKDEEFKKQPYLSIFGDAGRPDRGQLRSSTNQTAESENVGDVRDRDQSTSNNLQSSVPLSAVVADNGNNRNSEVGNDSGMDIIVGGEATQSGGHVELADGRPETEWEKLFRDEGARDKFAIAAANAVAAFLDINSPTINSSISGSSEPERRESAVAWCLAVLGSALDNFAMSVSLFVSRNQIHLNLHTEYQEEALN
jgi:hypothetical protein